MVELRDVDFASACAQWLYNDTSKLFPVNCKSNVIRMNCVVHICVVSTQVTMSIIYQ